MQSKSLCEKLLLSHSEMTTMTTMGSSLETFSKTSWFATTIKTLYNKWSRKSMSTSNSFWHLCTRQAGGQTHTYTHQVFEMMRRQWKITNKTKPTPGSLVHIQLKWKIYSNKRKRMVKWRWHSYHGLKLTTTPSPPEHEPNKQSKKNANTPVAKYVCIVAVSIE